MLISRDRVSTPYILFRSYLINWFEKLVLRRLNFYLVFGKVEGEYFKEITY